MGERLTPGDAAPDFTLPDDTGAQVTLLSEVDLGMARSGNAHNIRDLIAGSGEGYLYGVEFVERHDLPSYHPGVRTFEVRLVPVKPVDGLRMLQLMEQMGVFEIMSDRATTTIAEHIELLRSVVEAYDDLQAAEEEVSTPGELQDSEK